MAENWRPGFYGPAEEQWARWVWENVNQYLLADHYWIVRIQFGRKEMHAVMGPINTDTPLWSYHGYPVEFLANVESRLSAKVLRNGEQTTRVLW